MTAQIPEKFNQILETSQYIWFTTVREDGMPQPTPVWFVRDGDGILIYTEPKSHKVKNIRANVKVALGVSNEDAGEYIVIQGEAKIDESVAPPNQHPTYLQKYRQGIKDIGYTPESFAKTWSLPIRVMPILVRGEGA